jgi:hypothetical protein
MRRAHQKGRDKTKRLGKLLAGLAVVAGLGGGLSACNAAPFAASVDGYTLSMSNFNRLLSALSSNQTFVADASPSAPVFATGNNLDLSFVDSQLEEQIVYLAAKAALSKLNVSPKPVDYTVAQVEAPGAYPSGVFPTLPAKVRQELYQDFAYLAALETKVAHVDFGQAALSRYYETHQKLYAKYCTSTVVLSTRPQAEAVLARIRRGLGFVAAVEAYSIAKAETGPSGTVGCGTLAQYKGSFGSAVESAVSSLRPGEVGQPVELAGDWFLFKLDRLERPSLSSVLSQFVGSVWQKGLAASTRYLAKFLHRVPVQIDPEFGTLEVGPSGLRILPPPSPSPAAGPYWAVGQAGS